MGKAQKHLLAVNYWDSTLCVIPLSAETGEFTGPICSLYDPKRVNKVASALKKLGGCNHSNNDDSTIKERQKDPHSHALVLDPFVGCIAYVPDLGKDLIPACAPENLMDLVTSSFIRSLMLPMS